eukprot:gnl/TRDRNA2_/TRDRNA2_192366_c0_seq1.p1 gnl/TRDRNA2_/TRDRNA2_192366_c0~~gnl/TRDRNA2_/TRDRNA2_192366_c0_seq1.p1  ORF type:complete len:206 (-),score=39.76 gnl/TRDRNA2_/TRDRNA2_192366_c0_seq1:257-874(-)
MKSTRISSAMMNMQPTVASRQGASSVWDKPANQLPNPNLLDKSAWPSLSLDTDSASTPSFIPDKEGSDETSIDTESADSESVVSDGERKDSDKQELRAAAPAFVPQALSADANAFVPGYFYVPVPGFQPIAGFMPTNGSPPVIVPPAKRTPLRSKASAFMPKTHFIPPPPGLGDVAAPPGLELPPVEKAAAECIAPPPGLEPLEN